MLHSVLFSVSSLSALDVLCHWARKPQSGDLTYGSPDIQRYIQPVMGRKNSSMGLLKARVCDMCQDFKVVDFPEALAMRREMFVMGILC